MKRGFTLTELMIVMAIIGIVVAVAIPAFMTKRSGDQTVSTGVNGTVESRCVEGYKFVVDRRGNTRQVLDEQGKGVRCDNSGWK